MTLGGQSVTFDRVGEDDRGAGVVDLSVGILQGREVVAAEVADRLKEGGVVEMLDQGGNGGGLRALTR